MLFKKMLRDLKQNRVQFISIFLMLFIGVFIYTGVSSEWQGMQTSIDQYYKECNMAEQWIYGNQFTEEDMKAVKAEKHVNDVNRRMLLPITLQQKKIDLYILEDHNVSKMKVVQGEPYNSSVDGVWLDEEFAKANHYRLKDKVSFQYESYTFEYEIKGLVKHPEYIFAPPKGEMIPDHANYGYAFVSSEKFPYAPLINYNQMVVNNHSERINILDVLNRSNVIVVEREYLPSHATMQSEIEQHRVFGSIFPIAFLMIAFLTTITTMSRICINQRLQIGILKALGFKKKKLLKHYLSHIMFISTLGVLMGFIMGPLILPAFIFSMMADIYDLPILHATNDLSTILLLILCLSVSYLITYFVCRKQVSEKPVDALRGNRQVKIKLTPFEESGIWNRLGFNTQWNIRDIFRNKLRSIISIFGVFGCTALLFCAFSLSDSMSELMNWNYGGIQKYEMKVDLEFKQNENELNMLKDKMNGEYIQETAVELKTDITKKVSLSVLESNQFMAIMKDTHNAVNMSNDGIYLSYKVAQAMNVKKGEVLQWRNVGSDTWHAGVVNEIIRTPFTQGITMSKQYYQLFESFIPTSMIGNEASIDKHDYAVVKSINNQSDMIASTATMLEAMNILIIILVLGASLLIIVVLYNLGSLSYYEKEHDMATLKVLGFRTKHLKKILRQQNLWLTSLGVVLGILGGNLLLHIMMDTIGDTMDIIAVTMPLTYLICIAGTLVLSLIVMNIVARKLTLIDMVVALKAKE